MSLERSPKTLLALFALVLLGYRKDAVCQSPAADATASETAVSARAPSDNSGAMVSSASAPTGGFFQRLAKALQKMTGSRTGFKTKYTGHRIGWGHWIGSTILLRPELRFERSYDVPAYDNGTKKNQLMLAGDVIYFF